MSDNVLKRDFNIAIEKLNEDNNLSIFEKATVTYISSNPDYSPSKYVDYQLQAHNILGENAAIIMHYFKINEEILYEGKHKEIAKRLHDLKKIANIHFINMETSITAPDKLKGNLFSINRSRPREISGTLMKNDGSYFNFSLDFNDGLNLSSSIISNLNKKFNTGNNSIDMSIFTEFLDEVRVLNKNIEDLIESESQKKSQDIQSRDD